MNLPDTLSKALDAEDGEITTLQGSIWSEGRAGADLLVEVNLFLLIPRLDVCSSLVCFISTAVKTLEMK